MNFLKAQTRCAVTNLAITASLSLPVQAQNNTALRPDAGSLQKQTTSDTATPLPQPSARILEQPQPQGIVQPGESIVWVHSFRFKGNTQLSDAQLHEVLAHFTGRPLSFAQLQQAANALVLAYRRAGWLANSWLPQQVIDQGVVELAIEESTLGQLRVIHQGTARMDTAQINATAQFALQMHPNWSSLDRVDEVVNRLQNLPGVRVSANLRAGEQANTSDLMLLVDSDTPVQLSSSLDNLGHAATGTKRLSVQTQFNNALTIGDASIVQLSRSEGSEYARIHFSLPLGSRGLRMGTAISDMSYSLIGPFAALNAQGQAHTQSIEVSAPLSLSPQVQTRWSWQYDSRQYANHVNVLGTPNTVSQYGLKLQKITLQANWLHAFFGTANHTLQVAMTQGVLNLKETTQREIDALTANTQGRFQKINLLINRQQALSAGWNLRLQAELQRADKNLDSSEKMVLGGVSGIRAYPTGEASGAQGWTSTIELQKQLSNRWMSTLFYDHGQIQVFAKNQAPNGQVLTKLNSYALSGYGLSLQHLITPQISFSGTWSRRVGHNPAAQAGTGYDSDGQLSQDRWWFNLSFRS